MFRVHLNNWIKANPRSALYLLFVSSRISSFQHLPRYNGAEWKAPLKSLGSRYCSDVRGLWIGPPWCREAPVSRVVWSSEKLQPVFLFFPAQSAHTKQGRVGLELFQNILFLAPFFLKGRVLLYTKKGNPGIISEYTEMVKCSEKWKLFYLYKIIHEYFMLLCI